MRSHVARGREVARVAALACCVALTGIWSVSAQSIRPSVTGVVTDTSGAVLPGVTVEVTSPALIERVRSAVTDGRGTFRITELAPGTYTVTFTVPGFNTVRREGIALAGSKRPWA